MQMRQTLPETVHHPHIKLVVRNNKFLIFNLIVIEYHQ